MRSILQFLDALAEEGILLENLADKPDDEKRSGGFDRRYRRWRRSVFEAFDHLDLRQFSGEALSYCGVGSIGKPYEIACVAGLVESARDLLKSGLLGSIKFILHAEMFESMAEQARALLASGHTVPAGVLGRIVIEDWLHDQAEREGVKLKTGASAASVNEALKQASVFSLPKWRQIQTHLDVGNAAAHGKTKDFNPEDVTKLLDFIEANCI